ncbi:hypothetical protein [Budvicia diplopodorum]|nr:hypothetical protein [Budvicia diplopodorum]
MLPLAVINGKGICQGILLFAGWLANYTRHTSGCRCVEPRWCFAMPKEF